jgi:hypothetical protein
MSRWKNAERFLVAMNRSSLLRERIETTRASGEMFSEGDLLWRILNIKKRVTNHFVTRLLKLKRTGER